jgi:hypothetical protein
MLILGIFLGVINMYDVSEAGSASATSYNSNIPNAVDSIQRSGCVMKGRQFSQIFRARVLNQGGILGFRGGGNSAPTD